MASHGTCGYRPPGEKLTPRELSRIVIAQRRPPVDCIVFIGLKQFTIFVVSPWFDI